MSAVAALGLIGGKPALQSFLGAGQGEPHGLATKPWIIDIHHTASFLESHNMKAISVETVANAFRMLGEIDLNEEEPSPVAMTRKLEPPSSICGPEDCDLRRKPSQAADDLEPSPHSSKAVADIKASDGS